MAEHKIITNVIQLGGTQLDLADLSEDFEAIYVPDQDLDSFRHGKYNLFNDGQLDSHFLLAIYIIAGDAAVKDNADIIAQLPANNIIYDRQIDTTDEIANLFALRNAHPFDLNDSAAVARQISLYFFARQNGLKLGNTDFKIDESFTGEATQIGTTYTRFKASFGDDYRPLAQWRMAYWDSKDIEMEALPEQRVLEGNVQLQYHVCILDGLTEVKAEYVFDGDDVFQPQHFETGPDDINVYVNVWAKGTGTVNIGSVHIRQSRGGFGDLMVGGKHISDPENLNGQILYLFNAGDMKPPLNVYFSGYRETQGYEGFFMMQKMNSPFLLIADTRFEGGGFYIGSEKLEDAIVQVIEQSLQRLNFKHDQLILSGLSMGTFGALYYAARLNPYAVVAGKPLIHIGTIAENFRINRPDDFGTALDILLDATGHNNAAAVDELNDVFWQTFKKGNFKQTTFVFGYMLNDDYDVDAFPEMFDYLKERYPEGKILHKGLIGRHNDNTGGIVSYFSSQYYNLLTTGFDRHYE